MEVVGEQGTAWLDAFNQTISVSSDDSSGTGGSLRSASWGSDMDMGLMRDFLNMIDEDRAPSITGFDGLKALEVALGAYVSAERGEPVALPLSVEA